MNSGVSATLAPSLDGRRSMVWTDWAVLAIIGVSAVLSLFRGFVREAIALAGWIAGLWVAFNHLHVGAGWFERWVEAPEIRLVLGFVVLLAAVLIVAGLAARLAAGLIDVTGLGGLDRVLGMIFGAARGAIMVAGLVLLAGFTDLARESWWRESVLLPRFEALADEVARILPGGFAQRLDR